jgi:hypothetical protein
MLLRPRKRTHKRFADREFRRAVTPPWRWSIGIVSPAESPLLHDISDVDQPSLDRPPHHALRFGDLLDGLAIAQQNEDGPEDGVLQVVQQRLELVRARTNVSGGGTCGSSRSISAKLRRTQPRGAADSRSGSVGGDPAADGTGGSSPLCVSRRAF